MTQDEFMKLMEVQINKAQDKLDAKALYDLGVKRMNDAKGVEQS